MKGLGDLYVQQLKTGIATMLQYRASLLIWLIGNVLEPLVYLVVWSTVSRSTGGTVGGYGARDFAAYYIVLMLVNQATFSWVMYEFDYRIREGTFSADLLHPVHPIHADIAENLSSKAVSLPFMIAAAAGLTALFHPALHLTWLAAAIVAGGVIVYSFWLILATTAFWLVRVENILVIFQSVYEAGRWPVSIYPAWLRFALTFLVPVAFAITVPAQALAGRLSWPVLGGAWAFAAVLFVIARLFWRTGIRHYSGASS